SDSASAELGPHITELRRIPSIRRTAADFHAAFERMFASNPTERICERQQWADGTASGGIARRIEESPGEDYRCRIRRVPIVFGKKRVIDLLSLFARLIVRAIRIRSLVSNAHPKFVHHVRCDGGDQRPCI